MSELAASNGHVPNIATQPQEHLLMEGITVEDLREQMHTDYLAVLAAGPSLSRWEEVKRDLCSWRGHVPQSLKQLGAAAIGWVYDNSIKH